MAATVISNELIQREAHHVAKFYNIDYVKSACNYLPMSDIMQFYIVANGHYYNCECDPRDLRGSLNNFSDKYIRKGLFEIINSQTQYDDCGQII